MSGSNTSGDFSSSSGTKGKDLGMQRNIIKTRSRSCRMNDHKCELISASTSEMEAAYPANCWRRFKKRFLQSLLVKGNNRRCQTYLRSSAAVSNEEERQLLSPHWYMIHPFSGFRIFWQCIMSIALLVFIFYYPFRVTLYERLKNPFLDIMLIPSTCVRLVLLIDIGLTFITGTLSETTKEIVLDPWIISRKYLKGRFVLDVLTAFPYYYFKVIIPEDERSDTVLIILIMITICNVYRIVQLLDILGDLFEVIGMDESQSHMSSLILSYSIFLHWAACAQLIVPQLLHGPDLPQVTASWINMYGLLKPGTTILYKYQSAYVRSFATSLRLGYGQNNLQSTPEDAVVVTMILIIGYIFNAIVYGVLLHMISARYTSDLKYQSTMIQLKEYMKFKKLPHATRERMFMYYQNKYSKGYFNESAILSTLSGGIREEIYMHCCQRLISEVDIFYDLPADVLKAIIGNLRQEIYLPTDVIIKAGTFPESMYFLQNGTVAVFTPTGKEVCHLQDGDYFGEIALFGDNTRRVASVVAVDICDVYRLDRSDFKECVSTHSFLMNKILVKAEHRRQQTAIMEEDYKEKLNSDLL